MSNPSVHRVAAAALGLAIGLAPIARPAHATAPTLPSIGLAIPTATTADPIVARLLADHPDLHVLNAVVADVDGDGDLDILASTPDAPVVLWINDGTDHFTRSQAPARTSLSSEPGTTVRTVGRVAPSAVAGSKWQALNERAAPLPFTGTWTRLALASTTRRPTEILASGPSRAPPFTKSA